MVKNVFEIRKKCPFCNSKNFQVIFQKNFDSPDIVKFFKNHLNKNFPIKILKNEKYIILECKKCSGIFQRNILNKIYSEKFYEKYVPQNEALEKKNKNKRYLNKIFDYEISLLASYFQNEKKISVLEIGAGWGFWSLHAKNKNIDVTAIELSKTRIEYLKKKNIKVFSSTKNLKKKYNFIFSDQTLEHLSHPLEELKKFKNMLKKDGLIFIKVPPGIYIKKKLNSNYEICDDELIPLEHINVFNRNVNQIMAKKLNLRYLYPKNIYSKLSLNFYKRLIIDFYEHYSSKTILFKK